MRKSFPLTVTFPLNTLDGSPVTWRLQYCPCGDPSSIPTSVCLVLHFFPVFSSPVRVFFFRLWFVWEIFFCGDRCLPFFPGHWLRAVSILCIHFSLPFFFFPLPYRRPFPQTLVFFFPRPFFDPCAHLPPSLKRIAPEMLIDWPQHFCPPNLASLPDFPFFLCTLNRSHLVFQNFFSICAFPLVGPAKRLPCRHVSCIFPSPSWASFCP